MLNTILLYAGSIIIAIWGIAHIIPTKAVVAGFGKLSQDNTRIITMEWIAEGLTLVFIGVLTLAVTTASGRDDPGAVVVYRGCAVMLVVMAGLTLATGARTKVIPIKICPFVKAAVAVLFVVGSMG
jgi:hypothetical protein